MSVRKRTWQTPKGVERTGWQVDYLDQHGKRQRKLFSKSINGKTARDQAREFDKRTGGEVLEGTHVPDSGTVTIAKAGDLWIASGEIGTDDRPPLERTTLDQRRQHLELHIKPFIGSMRLNKLTSAGIRDFQDKLRAAGRSAAMVRRVTVSLGSIYADAQERQLTVRNPIHERSRARSKRPAARTRPRIEVGKDIPHTEEIKRLLAAATGRWRPLLVTMVFTGIRASEARGLRWSDVDLDKAIITVSQRADRYREIGSPKSDAGRRSIPLMPIVVNTLKEWKLACPKGDKGLVFPNTEGGVEFHQNMLQRGLWPAWIAAGVTVKTGKKDAEGNPLLAPKYPGFHALRHWYASWCINRKADGGLELPAKAVQERMGHGSIQVTFDTYGHMFPITDEKAALAAAERHLFGT